MIKKEFTVPELDRHLNNLLSRAIALATSAHSGQVDKGGFLYILHPLRVMEAVREYGQIYQIVAVLHDVVEDTPITLGDLLQSFPLVVVEAVDAISQRKGESGRLYLNRVMENQIATVVKIEDVNDNTRLDRLTHLSLREQHDKQMVAKERLGYLREARNRHLSTAIEEAVEAL
jgi:(p)ppGpp synthase/HD superfamily hydrolase